MALLGLNTFLVGALEHELFDFPYMGMSSSQVTNSIIFQRGRLNHQPAFKRQKKKDFPWKSLYSKGWFKLDSLCEIEDRMGQWAISA